MHGTSIFTYTVGPDGTLTIVTLTLDGKLLTGPEAGQTFTITNLPVISGMISKDRHTLTLHHDEPGVEIATFADGDVQHRICHRARILLELKAAK